MTKTKRNKYRELSRDWYCGTIMNEIKAQSTALLYWLNVQAIDKMRTAHELTG